MGILSPLVAAMLVAFVGASSKCFTTGTKSGIMCSNYDMKFSKSKITLNECMDLCTQSKAAGGCRAFFYSTKGGNCRHVYAESCKHKDATWPYQVRLSVKMGYSRLLFLCAQALLFCVLSFYSPYIRLPGLLKSVRLRWPYRIQRSY